MRPDRPVVVDPAGLRRPALAVLAAVVAAAVLALAAACAREGGEGAAGDDYDTRVAAEHAGDRPVAGAAEAIGAAGDDVEVTAGEVIYGSADGRELRGFLAQPAGAERRPDDGLPGLILIHEWWGLNENMETMARRFAEQGYVALAVDLYGGEVAEDPQRARQLSQTVEQEPALDNLRQATHYLAEEQRAPRVGVVGWCFGGAWSLQAALAMPAALSAAVVYYGRLVTERELLGTLETPLLGIFGAEDSSIPVEDVRRFESTLQALDKDAEVHVYEGAGHAFANPSGERYRPEAAQDAWEKTLVFLAEHLKS